MKHAGAVADYISARNEDLYSAFRKNLEAARKVKISDIVEKTVKSPAKRFYTSDRRAQDVITRLLEGGSIDDMRPERKRMFEEIYRRCMERMSSGRAVPLVELVREVIAQPAPEFYITTGSALIYLCRIKAARNEKK